MKEHRLLGSLFFFLLVAGLIAFPGAAQTDGTQKGPKAKKLQGPATWVELGENGVIIARQVLLPNSTDVAPTCPSIQINGAAMQMQPRGPVPDGFPPVCQAVIPNGTTSASIGGIQLPLPEGTISKIVLIGDTGCKGDTTGTGKKVEPIDEADEQEEAEEAAPAKAAAGKKPKPTPTPKQDCTTTFGKSGWPFPKVSKHAAGEKPDLVIHVGDYVYIKGDNWANWNAQFFQPAHELLLAAPWIFVRGNHENCSLHGMGFFYLLDPRAVQSCMSQVNSPSSCPQDNSADSRPPYLVTVGGSQFVVMDSSGANCDFANNEPGACTQACFTSEVKTWTGLFNQAKQLLGSGNAFLLTHRPLWGLKPGKSTDPALTPTCDKGETPIAINSTLQAGYENSGITGITMILSGHIHNFQLITYNPMSGISPQPQLVVGDSGVKLSTPPESGNDKCTVVAQNGYLERSTFLSWKEFGFGVLKDGGSKFDLYRRQGDLGLKCDISPNKATCKKEKKKSVATRSSPAAAKQK